MLSEDFREARFRNSDRTNRKTVDNANIATA